MTRFFLALVIVATGLIILLALATQNIIVIDKPNPAFFSFSILPALARLIVDCSVDCNPLPHDGRVN